ncbi:type II secretion system protein GspM [Candidatus Clostridium radicumherbarum]|uniref:Type II secretion system protein GspM n=1 Tax=Candidatus Clostridium radicumherbarum TaxID=3381662 RepID=A0ABW8TS50_9CLOT
MNGLNKSEKILLSLLAIVVVGYVYYNFIIEPLTSKIGTVQNSIENYQQQLNASKIMAVSNKKMTSELEKLKANYNNYLKLMPKSNMTAQIERDIKQYADDNDVIINSLTIGKEIDYKKQTNGANGNAAIKGNQNTNATQANNQQNTSANTSLQKIMAIPVVINITGDFTSTTAFINTLETAGRIADITSMNFSSKGKQGLTVEINANILYAKDGTTIKNNYDFNNGNYSKVNPFN